MLTTEKQNKAWIIKEGENPIWTLNKKLSKEELEGLESLLQTNSINASRATTKAITTNITGFLIGML